MSEMVKYEYVIQMSMKAFKAFCRARKLGPLWENKVSLVPGKSVTVRLTTWQAAQFSGYGINIQMLWEPED